MNNTEPIPWTDAGPDVEARKEALAGADSDDDRRFSVLIRVAAIGA